MSAVNLTNLTEVEEMPGTFDLFKDFAKRIWRIRGFKIGSVLLMILIMGAIFAPYIGEGDPYTIDRTKQLAPPSSENILGADQQGRDLLSRILYGGRTSLLIGLVAVAVGGVLGGFLGLIAGFLGGWVDELVMRIVDVMLAFPGILLALVVVIILGPGIVNVMIAVGISRAPRFARLVRGSVLSVKEEEYVMAARAIGAGDLAIMGRHILRNIFGPVLIYSTLGVGTAILAAAAMGYLGLGARPPHPEWGLMLSQARDFMRIAWWSTTFPGIAIMITVISINLIGDALRDVLDPRLKT